MLRLGLALATGLVATGMALAVVAIFLVSAGALPARGEEENAASAQYSTEDLGHAEPASDVPPTHFEAEVPDSGYYAFYARWLAGEVASSEATSSEATLSEAAPSEGTPSRSTPSEGSAPGARAPAAALSITEPAVPYAHVVDNASSERFYSEDGWKKSSRRASRYGKDYSYIRPTKDAPPAWFKVNIPTAGYYTVFARWPAARRNNPATRFQISTASGLESVRVDQRRDGGTWVRLGAFEMAAGDRYSVQVAGRSRAEGRILADAVMVVAGTQAPLRADLDGAAGEPAAGEPATGEPATGAETAASGEVSGAEVVERARTHLGTPYRHSPPLPCEAYRSEDCSCLTSLVFSPWLTLPDNPIDQWNMGRSVERSNLRPGDLVFFKEAGESFPITHVAIYSGGGNIIHASTYWGQVVERPMEYVSGYYGAKRLD